MNKYVLLLLFLLLPVSFSAAYTPITWNEEWASRDVESSDVILIGRVIKLERVPVSPLYQEKHSVFFSCVATISVGSILKGKEALDGRDSIEICFGGTEFYFEKEITYKAYREQDAEPSGIRYANTQQGFDLRFNEVYLLFIDKQNRDGLKTTFEPRSGPFSIGRITKDYFSKKAGDGSEVRFTKKFISMCSIGNEWKKEVPLDEYLKDIGLVE